MTILLTIAAILAFVAGYVYISFKKMKNAPEVEKSVRIKDLTDKNFNHQIKDNISLVDFWAPWCMPCKMMAPVMNEIADKGLPGVQVCKVNVDEFQSVAGKIWGKDKIREVLEGGLAYLSGALKIKHKLKIDFIDILGEREVGKYFCGKCGMFFEFGLKRESVTCPLMSQKCMFDPQSIEKINFTADKLLKQFQITPGIYNRFIAATGERKDVKELSYKLLNEWKITERQDEIVDELISFQGLKNS
jgi:thioredoxin 1